MLVTNELILESLSEIPDAPTQRMERPSHNPPELPRSRVKSHVPLSGAVTLFRRLHSTVRFRNFVFKYEAPWSAGWERINNITLSLEGYITGLEIRISIALRLPLPH